MHERRVAVSGGTPETLVVDTTDGAIVDHHELRFTCAPSLPYHRSLTEPTLRSFPSSTRPADRWPAAA